jgi:deoxyadenosine/deoxycytidine kinase
MDQYKKAIKWLELSLLIQPEKNQYYTKLYNELYNFNIHKQSFILQKKQENYKFVIENKFNKHYR